MDPDVDVLKARVVLGMDVVIVAVVGVVGMDVVLSVSEHKEGKRGSTEDSDGFGSVPHRTDEAGMNASVASSVQYLKEN